jgi:hypothetical protein
MSKQTDSLFPATQPAGRLRLLCSTAMAIIIVRVDPVDGVVNGNRVATEAKRLDAIRDRSVLQRSRVML